MNWYLSVRSDLVTFHRDVMRTVGIIITILLVGCATPGTVRKIDRLETVGDNARFLIMTPDVKYYLLTTGGVPLVQAEWTESARVNFSKSLQDFAEERNIEIVTTAQGSQLTDTEISYQKLYSAVGSSILTHHYGRYKLPTKYNSFDWTLGPGIEVIGKKYGADYALFSYYRDYQGSGGRIAFSLVAALLLLPIPAGGEFGFASLVDLRTGDIVWFNRVGYTDGELMEQDSARTTIDELFKNLPIKEKPYLGPDISGTYISFITGNTQTLDLNGQQPLVKLVQNGSSITGKYGDSSGKIWGDLDGDTFKFEWSSKSGNTGKGRWIFNPESNEITGTWNSSWIGDGKWNLKRIE